MPRRTVPGTDFEYHLVLFDEDGQEREELDGSLHSATIVQQASAGVTDIFVLSHGWKGDIPAAIQQYDRWVGVMARQDRDLQRLRSQDPGLRPLVVCVHWPSLPWGVEEVGAALLSGDGTTRADDVDDFAVEDGLDAARLVDLYAPRIGDSPATRRALTTILRTAEDPEQIDVVEAAALDGHLPEHLASAYRTLFEQAGLSEEVPVGAPGADQQDFAPGPTLRVWAARDGQQQPAGPLLLGGGADPASRLRRAKDLVLGPVRQVSFWTMKRRARVVGEAGVHDLVAALQRAAADARVHLMGHSFGCIVVSAAIAGPRSGEGFPSVLPQPVDAVFLVQGAMSLWSYAERISFADNQPGYFHALLDPRRIKGPLVTTRSDFDTAVLKYYPLGARVVDQVTLDGGLPKFGGIGAWGIEGAAAKVVDILAPSAEYGLRPGQVLNVRADRVIRNGTGPSGAHSDIAHDEVAHLMWQAVAASRLG